MLNEMSLMHRRAREGRHSACGLCSWLINTPLLLKVNLPCVGQTRFTESRRCS